MFASIAPRYDLLNRLLSLGLDQGWRRKMIARLPALQAGDRVLDLCTGTGDVAQALCAGLPDDVVVHAGDFCEAMVERAPEKTAEQSRPASFFVGDVLALPYPEATVKAITVAFGLRNVQDPAAGLVEMARVLASGGRLIVLEFSKPKTKLFNALFRLYVFGILPRVGRFLSGSSVDAYRYLPESVWAWAGPEVLARQMEAAGLTVLEQKPLLLGGVMLHVAERRG